MIDLNFNLASSALLTMASSKKYDKSKPSVAMAVRGKSKEQASTGRD